MLPSVGLDDPNQKTYPRIMKTPARLLTGHGKSRKANVCSNFFKRVMWLGKILILPSIFKTISFEKDSCEKTWFQFCWYRKSLLLANNKGTDQTAIMSKPAYLSVEIVTDKPTSGKISIPQGSLCSWANWIVPNLVANPVLIMSTCLCINSACWVIFRGVCYLQTFISTSFMSRTGYIQTS